MDEWLRGKIFRWSTEKNEVLMRVRGISFEEIILAVEDNRVIDFFPHPNSSKYPHQYILIVYLYHEYFVIPCVVTEEEIFLKTMYPSRVARKKYDQ